MTLLEIVGGSGLLIVILSLIKIKPLEINVFQLLARSLGNAMNHDMIEKFTELDNKLDRHISHDKKKEALENRRVILRFANELLTDRKHTKEEFQYALEVIDSYEEYCKDHPDFPNSRAIFAIKLIKDNYSERLGKADFLAEEYRSKEYKERNLE